MEDKCCALLIGGDVSTERVPGNAGVHRQPLDKSRNARDGVLKDLQSVHNFMNDRRIPVFEVMLINRCVKQDKKDILEIFIKFLSQKDIRRFVIYYSGPGSNGTFGTNNGDWCFETNHEKTMSYENNLSQESESRMVYIGLNDILKLWDEIRGHYGSDSYEFKDRDLLFIIADCCRSGSWVEEIKAKRTKKTTPSNEHYRDVNMIASCLSNETCYYTADNGGEFTYRYINADTSRHNLSDTGAHVAKVAAQMIVFQGITFPFYMPIKGISNYLIATSHRNTPVATNEKETYRIWLMKYVGEKLPIGRGLGIASGWSWMIHGQILRT